MSYESSAQRLCWKPKGVYNKNQDTILALLTRNLKPVKLNQDYQYIQFYTHKIKEDNAVHLDLMHIASCIFKAY